MPYLFHLHADHLEVRLTGNLSGPELLSIAQGLAELEAAVPVTPHRLTDLTEVEAMHLDYAGVSDFAEKRRGAVLKNPVRSAIVYGTAEQLGFARMYQTLHDNPKIEIEIFPEPEPARQWLRQAGGKA